ncbi:hypothetical protein [Paenibacillus sp. NRS-1760]|uniref:hypothetical protein n=1 Tax=Paenibacillus sp. NRS-1760 TaxID=3233902 RepID=UPI003D2DBD9C
MINQIKEALEKATPGQWIAEEHGWDNPALLLSYEGDKVSQQIAEFGFQNESADAHLIANAPTWLRYLLDVLEKANNVIVDQNGHIEGLKVAKEIEIENHTQSCFDYQDQIIKKDNEMAILRNEHTAMKEALKWYADEKNHKENVVDQWEPVIPIAKDEGKKARAVLASLTMEANKNG